MHGAPQPEVAEEVVAGFFAGELDHGGGMVPPRPSTNVR
jgi:hypothetical protein